jgi:hypothetical protein
VPLTIPAGTTIEGTGGTSSYIAIAQGGKLNVNGTAAKPVIMTSGLTTKPQVTGRVKSVVKHLSTV